MKTNKIYMMIAAALSVMMFSCEYNAQFEGLEDDIRPTDVQKIEYTLEELDYLEILKIVEESEDSLETPFFKKNMTFYDALPASKYIPLYFEKKYYMLSKGSEVNATYRDMGNIPQYITNINKGARHNVSAEDFVWSSDSTIDFFSPSMPDTTYIPLILATQFADATSNSVVHVYYKRSDKELVGGEDTVLVDCNELYVLNKGEWGLYDYEKANLSIIRKADFEAMGGDHANFSNSMPSEKYLPQYFAAKYPYAQEDDVAAAAFDYYDSGSTSFVSEEFVFIGGVWTKNVGNVTSKFARRAKWIYDTSVRENFEQFTATVRQAYILGWTNVTVQGGDVYWSGKNWGKNGYLEASAYYATDTLEAWMITPACVVEEGMMFSFDEKHRYYKGKALSIMISEDFKAGADATANILAVGAATWTNVTEKFTINTPEEADNSSESDFESAGVMDLSEYVGRTIHIGFLYNGHKARVTSSVQIDNVLIAVPE